jgi:phospholipase C
VGLPSLTARDAAANDFLHLLAAQEPRDAPHTLPPPADSGVDCEERRASEDPQADLEPVDAALRGFVQLAAIQEARLEPPLRTRVADRVQAITTKGEACEYLVEVAAKLRAAGVVG